MTAFSKVVSELLLSGENISPPNSRMYFSSSFMGRKPYCCSSSDVSELNSFLFHSCTIFPFSRKTTRSTRSFRYHNLCSEMIIVFPLSFHLRITFFSSPIAFQSRLEDGSSSMMISGINADTLAQAIFCFSPPESAKRLFSSRASSSSSFTTSAFLRHISAGGSPMFSVPKVISPSVSTAKN